MDCNHEKNEEILGVTFCNICGWYSIGSNAKNEFEKCMLDINEFQSRNREYLYECQAGEINCKNEQDEYARNLMYNLKIFIAHKEEYQKGLFMSCDIDHNGNVHKTTWIKQFLEATAYLVEEAKKIKNN